MVAISRGAWARYRGKHQRGRFDELTRVGEDKGRWEKGGWRGGIKPRKSTKKLRKAKKK